MKHSMHFTGNARSYGSDEMDYCASHLDSFIKFTTIQTNEFDGDNENEVTFTTSSSIPQTKITKILKHFQPAGHTFNQ